MNVLLLGNGFDLYHKLPTRYDNFLHTVDFLINNYTSEMTTVADVFGNEKLQTANNFILECYNQHKISYEQTKLEEEKIKEIINNTNRNIWFSYLFKSFNKEIGWIDLEREIAFVIEAFKEFFSTPDLRFNIARKMPSVGYQYVIEQFSFFLTPITNSGIVNGPTHKVKPDYTITIPVNSKNTLVNKEKIISKLSEELDCLTKALKLYLQCFVDNALIEIQSNSLSKCQAIDYINQAISFNYTNTYEKCYLSNDIFHLHGNLNKKIILGINPDDSDNIETVDTSFVQFKKYFQRTDFETDNSYNRWISNLDEYDYCILTVMGHSLDVTDKDILIPLFRKMSEITILYHSTSAKKDYIRNLIKIFGMDEFERLRKQKSLKFLSLDTDFKSFTMHLAKNFDI